MNTIKRRDFIKQTGWAGVAALAPLGLQADLAAAAGNKWASVMRRLANKYIAVTFDPSTGGIMSIENKQTGQRTTVNDAGFEFSLGTGMLAGPLGPITPGACTLGETTAKDGTVTFRFKHPQARVLVTYRLDAEDAFVVKRVRVERTAPGPWHVSRMVMFDWKLTPQPARLIPYYGVRRLGAWANLDDGEEVPPSETSTAFVMRQGEGGLFTTVSTDFACMSADEVAGRCVSTYWPGRLMDTGTAFESEAGIAGVYARKGLFHAPIGASHAEMKHFHDPEIDTRLDRAEIDVVCAAVRKLIRQGVYIIMVNGWGVGLPRIIEDRESADAFKRAIDTLVKVPEMMALHFVHSWCGLTREFREQGLALKVQPNPFAEEAFLYAGSKGIGLSMFIGTSNNYPLQTERPLLLKNPELLSVDENGRQRPGNIALSPPYLDCIGRTVRTVHEMYLLRGLTFDFLSLQRDYYPNHGYLTGRNSLYSQYTNLRELNRGLRNDFPDLMLRGQIGWMFLGPWLADTFSLCHNAHDHNANNLRNFLDFHIDHQYANNIRASNWYSNNCRMYPRHKMNSNSIHNGSVARAWDYGAFHYAVLSQMASGDCFGMFHDLPDEVNGEVWLEEDLAFFKKWVVWQRERRDYYLRENELFGVPRRTGVDGYAYGSPEGTDSIVFLCNPTYRTERVALPINGEIHVTPNSDYTVRELYPEERYRLGPDAGVFAYDTVYAVDVPPQTVMVLEVHPDQVDETLLLDVGGALEPNGHGYGLSGVAGPQGTQRVFAIRPGRGPVPKDGTLTINGAPAEVRKRDGLWLGAVQFDGSPIEAEVRDYKVREVDGRLRITAHIPAAAAAQALLKSQQYPVAKDYDTDEWRATAAWLNWNRFIIFLPIVPRDLDDFSAVGKKLAAALKEFDGTAELNGQPIPINTNTLCGEQRGRYAGLFIDATAAIEYGKANWLTLDLPLTSEDRFFGIFLPNLARGGNGAAHPMLPPRRLTVEDAPEAAEAIAAPPVVEDNHGRLRLWLRLTLTGLRQPAKPADISVRDGVMHNVAVSEPDARWKTEQAVRKPQHIQLCVTGTRGTVVRLGRDDGSCEFTLGWVMDTWRAQGDRFDSVVASLPWAAMQAEVALELGAPPRMARRVRDGV